MQSEAKVHFQDKPQPKIKEEEYLCDECGEPISRRDSEKDGLCNECRRELGIR